MAKSERKAARARYRAGVRAAHEEVSAAHAVKGDELASITADCDARRKQSRADIATDCAASRARVRAEYAAAAETGRDIRLAARTEYARQIRQRPGRHERRHSVDESDNLALASVAPEHEAAFLAHRARFPYEWSPDMRAERFEEWMQEMLDGAPGDYWALVAGPELSSADYDRAAAAHYAAEALDEAVPF